MTAAAIEKYRKAKAIIDAEDYQSGVEAGKEWATQSDPPPYAEVRNLAAAREGLESAGYEDFDFVANIIFGDDEPDDMAVYDFFYRAIGDNYFHKVHKPCYLRGFCEAAIEVWDELTPHLS